ncbi:MAG: HupE/UreJ family protein [Pikeienuella sp.]
MNLAFRLLGQALTVIAFALLASAANAHQLRPALAELSFADDGASFEIAIQTSAEAIIAEIGAEHDDTDDSPNAARYNELRGLSPEALRAALDAYAPKLLDSISVMAGDERLTTTFTNATIPPVGDETLARDSIITISGTLPEGTSAVTFGWDESRGPIVVRTPVNEAGEGFSAFLSNGDVSAPIAVVGAKTDALSAFISYIGVGFEHIVPLGLDHILFVIGLFLLSTQMRPLLIQVTAFTAAHTVTLALGILGIVTIPGSIVEPLIALSIVYVAVENLASPTLSRWRPYIVFAFGLLHGLGFAGVLSEFGLAPGQFAVSLIAFNIGVELGQLFVVAACFAIVGYWFGARDWYRLRIVWPASIAIGGYALAWFIERSLEIALPLYIVVALTIAIGFGIMAGKAMLADRRGAAYVLVVGAALTLVLRVLEGMIP